MDKRYQVFVSSTYTDLVQERSEVMQALLELECMPAGMELFPAANDTQWNWIKRVIDESDYYIVIVAGRYGTTSKETGLSYTEMEYQYAVDRGKPVIGFLHEDISKLTAKQTELSSSNRKKLVGFRDLVSSRLCKMYNSPADLGAKVSRSLTQLKKQYPTDGWIRATILSTLTSSEEVLKLKDENEQLKQKIYLLGLQKPESAERFASGNELYEIDFLFTRKSRVPGSKYFKKVTEQCDSIKLSWDVMFSVIGPDLIENPEYWLLTSALIPLIRHVALKKLESRYPNERFYDFKILAESANTILTQFRALQLMSVNSNGKYELTPYGNTYIADLLAVKKGKTR